MTDGFRSPAAFGEDEFTEKKSRFIGASAPAADEAEALAFVASRRAAHPQASAHAYAYSFTDLNILRFNDSGEPSGTAGKPIAELLQKEKLSHAVCVVTRYFGGIKLGAGGLTRAFSRGARLALDKSGVAVMRLSPVVEVVCPYTFWKSVERELGDYGAELRAQDFAADVTVRLSLAPDTLPAFTARLNDLTAGAILIEQIGEVWRQV